MNGEFETVAGTDLNMISNYSVTGSSRSIISAAVAYQLNLHGPAITLDTACSSSLVAIHMAAQAIKSGEISMGICGGVNVLMNPSMFVALAKARMASPTGKCHTFSNQADGYARGEGCGIVFLKKLGDAIKDNNKIWGTIRTGCNQDGHENSPITAPSGDQQVRLLQRIYGKAGIHPQLIQYIEAHGTGTPVGDPIEVNALGSYFGQDCAENKIMIGSVKTNIGHLESGAGIAGLIKILLMMKKERFVPSLHASELNENIPFEKYGFKVCQKVEKWNPDNQGARIACVNCFGFGGTNSHAIVFCNEIATSSKRACISRKGSKNIAFPSRTIFVLSAATRESFKKNADHLSQNVQMISNLCDLSYTSIYRRDHFKYRQLMVANDKSDLQKQLGQLSEAKNLFQNLAFKPPNIVYVFCGVGTSWGGMCQEMIESSPKFKESITNIDKSLRAVDASMSVFEMLQSTEDITRNPIKNHIAIFACQIALCATWKHIGIFPTAIIGQSVGEVAAAHACGLLTLEDAVKVIYHRSQALASCKTGCMRVIRNCPVKDVEECCKNLVGHKSNIAVYNSNESCTVSGDSSALTEMKKLLPKEAKFIPLQTDCAYHSPHTIPAGEKVVEHLNDLTLNAPNADIFSTVTGSEVKDMHFASASYWAENITKPVLFKQAVEAVKSKYENVIFLEIGPGPVLRAHLSSIFGHSDEIALPSMNKESEVPTFINSLSLLFEKGINPVWENLAPNDGTLCSFPNYIFSKVDCSFQSEKVRRWTQENNLDAANGRIVKKLPGQNTTFIVEISKSNTPFVFEHIVENRILIPGALFGEIGLEIGRHIYGGEIENTEIGWTIVSPLEVNSNEEKSLIVSTNNVDDNETTFFVNVDGETRVLANGTILKRESPAFPSLLDVSAIGFSLGKRKMQFDIYRHLSNLGFNHGPMFRIITDFEVEMNEGLAKISLPKNVLMDLHKASFHPVLIDGMFQSCRHSNLALLIPPNSRILPVKVSSLTVKQAPTQKMLCYTKMMLHHNSKLVFNAILLKENGSIVAEIVGFEMQIVSDGPEHHKLFFEEKWKETDVPNLPLSSRRQRIILSWSERKLQPMRDILSEVLESIQNVNLSSCHERECFIRNVTNLKNKTLVYVPGMLPLNEDTEQKHVYENIKQNAHFFLQVLQSLNMAKNRILIITENVQMISKCSTVGVMGSELWGMTRSFLKENTAANIIMCDVHGNLAHLRRQLCRMISFLENDVGHESSKEFAISGEKIFTNTFDRIPAGEFEISFRREKMTEGKKVVVRSSSNRNMLPFFVVPALSQSCYTKQDYNIYIQEVLLCSQELLFLPYDLTPMKQHWGPEKNAGHDVLCCEFSGLFEKGQKQIEVIGCCLKSIKSNVHVKRSCVCLKSIVKHYKIGMFYTMTVAMSFADLIERKSSVFVIYDINYKNISEELCHLLQQNLCITNTAEFDSSKDIQHPTATALIILSKHIICSLDVINHCFPMLEHLLSVRGLLSLSAYAAHPTRDKIIKTSLIDLYEIFKETSMQTTFFHVKRWLANAKNQCVIDNQDCVLNFAVVKPTFPLRVPKQMLIRPDSAYVVIGGLSGLGWEIMKFLTSHKAKIVISMSRRSPSRTEKYRLENLKLLRNTEVWHVNADITDRINLENAFFDLEIRLAKTPIRGIFHGAAVLQDAPVDKLTLDMFDKPLLPKIVGTLNLHHVTKHLELDYFLLHSSVVSLLGNGSQTNYAAANSFMDAFAHYRRSIGKSAQVINWGLLNVGMGADENIQSINALNGLFPISTAQITSSLMHILLMNRTQMMVADIDVSVRSIKFEDLQVPRVRSKLQENHNIVNLLQSESQSTEDLLDMWISFVKMSSASVLSVESDEIKESSILLDYGLDSQKAIELVNYLYSHSQIRLPVVYLITGKNTVKTIAEYFLNKAIHTKDTSDEEYVSYSPSYLEQHYFDLLEENEDNPHLAIMVDLTISGRLNDSESWKIAVLNLIMMNPELRTVFKSTEHGQKRGNKMRVVLDIEDINLQFENVNTKEDLDKTSESLRKFNPNEDIPVRFVYWQSSDFGCLRLIFSHCAFDNGSVSVLAKDLEMTLRYTIAKQTIPDSMIRRAVDPALIMEQNLVSEMENLQSYWKSELLTCNEKHSFTSLYRPDTDCDLGKYLVLSRKCDERLVMKLNEYAKHRKVPLFSLFCTPYQLSLCAFLLNKRVCVISATDMRMHFPELLERAVLCVNYIPLVSPELSASQSIHDIVKENSERIAVSLSKSNLPFKFMKGMSEFKKNVHSVHTIILEDLTVWNKFNSNSVAMTKFKVDQDATFETCLSIIIHSEMNIDLKLQVSTENVGKYNGESILENIEKLIHVMPFKAELHVHDLTSTCSIEQGIGNLSSDLYGISLTLPQSEVKLALKNRRARDAWIAVLTRKMSESSFRTSQDTRL